MVHLTPSLQKYRPNLLLCQSQIWCLPASHNLMFTFKTSISLAFRILWWQSSTHMVRQQRKPGLPKRVRVMSQSPNIMPICRQLEYCSQRHMPICRQLEYCSQRHMPICRQLEYCSQRHMPICRQLKYCSQRHMPTVGVFFRNHNPEYRKIVSGFRLLCVNSVVTLLILH